MYFIIVRDEKTGRFITERVGTADEASTLIEQLHAIGELDVYVAKQIDTKGGKICEV